MIERGNKFCLIYLIVFWMTVSSLTLFAQQRNAPYYLEEDLVVFVFDLRDYAEAERNGNVEKMDFADLKIHRVAVAGEFNNWSQDGWTMKKTGEYTYELRKQISGFDDVFPKQFKYVINEEYWAQPDVTFARNRNFPNDFLEDTYNLELYNINKNPNGNTTFFLPGHQTKREVILTGDFIGWDEEKLMMDKELTGWRIKIDLPPGRYEYKFIVDNEWIHDPENPLTVRNEHGTLNSILQKAKLLEFELKGHLGSSQVYVAGSFNKWIQIPMNKTTDGWKIELPVGGGKHRYKFIADGKWMLDPENPLVEKAREGIEYSVLLLR